MTGDKGHESGHEAHVVDAFTWREYVESLVRETGGWSDLANALMERAGEKDQLPEDQANVVKQLRRLAGKKNRGDKYGRLLLHYFGLPPSITEWGRLMGQYHSRFTDLPVGLRRQQLLRWDRPPVSESSAAIWVHIGLASLAHRERRIEEVHERLRLASEVRKPDKVAYVEYLLLSARLASDEGRTDAECDFVEKAEQQLDQQSISKDDAACYRARIADQRAYRASRDWKRDPSGLTPALEMYSSIPDTDVPPFVSFRRELGRAWCTWRLGDPILAMEFARRANEFAGDGGFVRFRIMALNLMAAITGDSGAAELRERARRLARMLEDAELLDRLDRHEAKSLHAKTP